MDWTTHLVALSLLLLLLPLLLLLLLPLLLLGLLLLSLLTVTLTEGGATTCPPVSWDIALIGRPSASLGNPHFLNWELPG